MTPLPFPTPPAANELPTPPRALLRGTMVERFEILRVIADAASNIEYVALDHAERIEVVLKEYMPQRLGRRKADLLRPLTPAAGVALALGLRSFSDEGRLLAGIDHPSLVRVLGMIEANGTAYMVMPLYDGLRLQHARQAMSVPPDERLLRPLIDGLLDALEAMHRKGVLHGAVGPNNILLLSDERAVLLGPDLARHVIADDLVESLMTAVEPSFEAPEQLAPAPSKPLGPWTDLYGLAETLRFCISGELRAPHVSPGERRETMAQMVHRLFGDPPSAVYSAALLETMDLALEPRAAARPQTTTRFRELLGALSPAPDDEAFAGAAFAGPHAVSPNATAAPAAGRIEPAFDAKRAIAAAALASTRARAVPPRRAGRGLALVLIACAAALGGSWRMGWWSVGPAGVRVAMPTLTEPATPARDAATPAPSPPAPVPAAAPSTPTATAIPATPAEPAPATVTAAAPAPSAPLASAALPAPEAVPAPPVAPATATPVAPPPAATPVVPAPAAPADRAARTALASPRDACDGRTQFALYRCMQQQCEQRVWLHHPQCELLRTTDKVPP